VCSANQVDVVLAVELSNDVLSECEANTSIVVAVLFNTALGIRPEQITQQASIRHISGSHDVFDLLELFEFGTQTSMHAENLLVDQRGHWQAVEHVREDLPESDGIPAFTLIIKPVNAVDLGALVVTTKQEEVLRVLDFVAEKETYCLDGLLSSVDVVSQEEVVGLGWEASILKNAQQIIVLAVDVT
jgi:hypothetical protein